MGHKAGCSDEFKTTQAPTQQAACCHRRRHIHGRGAGCRAGRRTSRTAAPTSTATAAKRKFVEPEVKQGATKKTKRDPTAATTTTATTASPTGTTTATKRVYTATIDVLDRDTLQTDGDDTEPQLTAGSTHSDSVIASTRDDAIAFFQKLWSVTKPPELYGGKLKFKSTAHEPRMFLWVYASNPSTAVGRWIRAIVDTRTGCTATSLPQAVSADLRLPFPSQLKAKLKPANDFTIARYANGSVETRAKRVANLDIGLHGTEKFSLIESGGAEPVLGMLALECLNLHPDVESKLTFPNENCEYA